MGWGGARSAKLRFSDMEIKTQSDFVDTNIWMVLRDLTISQNQTLKSADG